MPYVVTDHRRYKYFDDLRSAADYIRSQNDPSLKLYEDTGWGTLKEIPPLELLKLVQSYPPSPQRKVTNELQNENLRETNAFSPQFLENKNSQEGSKNVHEMLFSSPNVRGDNQMKRKVKRHSVGNSLDDSKVSTSVSGVLVSILVKIIAVIIVLILYFVFFPRFINNTIRAFAGG